MTKKNLVRITIREERRTEYIDITRLGTCTDSSGTSGDAILVFGKKSNYNFSIIFSRFYFVWPKEVSGYDLAVVGGKIDVLGKICSEKALFHMFEVFRKNLSNHILPICIFLNFGEKVA